jgi:hypothetical protein
VHFDILVLKREKSIAGGKEDIGLSVLGVGEKEHAFG